MDKKGFPRGHTTAARFKVLHAHLLAVRGPEAAAQWLAEVRVRGEELEDETRQLPLAALVSALGAFARVLSADAIAELGPRYLDRGVLGLWAPIVRGAPTPEVAFTRLDGAESEYGRTTVWETLETSPGRWRGRVRVAHDPALEASGHLGALRAAELSAVPCLFGLPPGHVTRAGEPLAQELTVSWDAPASEGRVAVAGASLGFLAGGLAGVALATPSALLAPLAAAVVGGLVGRAAGRARRATVVARAQALRMAALERTLALRELREPSAAGDLGGTLVAGQYRLGKSMGSGATGVIYEAVRVSDDRPVAVKLLRAAAAYDTVASDRLRREAEALGLAWHPNVVEAIDHGHLPDGSAYLVMELLRGESLAERVRARGRLPEGEVLPLAITLAEALAAVHAAGVVHRDIKPDNVFLARQDDAGEIVKILDFGIARVEWEEMRITHLGAPMGTPGYMAPEQETGAEADARADIYALGATLHECLTGELPGASLEGVAREPDPRGALPPSGVHRSASPISPALRGVLARCLATDREARFPDARAVAQALRAVSDHAESVAEDAR